jgi:hypothetical protein
MEKFRFINLADAREMSERKLQLEIGKHTKHLREQLGMNADEAAYFTASLLNMGVAMNERLESKKKAEKR